MKILNRIQLIGIFFIFSCVSQQSEVVPKLVWGKQMGSTNEEFGKSIDIDENSNIYITGWINDTADKNAIGGYDIFINKHDSSGQLLWHKVFGSPDDEWAEWIVSHNDYLLVCGRSLGDLYDRNKGKSDAFLMKVNAAGEQVWIKQVGSEFDETFNFVTVDDLGNIYAIGTTDGNISGNALGKKDALLIKFDNEGETVWKRQCGSDEDDQGRGVYLDKNYNIYICGTAHGPLWQKGQEKTDAFYAKYSKDGELLWYEEFGTDSFETANVILVDEEKNMYIGGSTGGDLGGKQAGNGDAFLVKLNKNKEVQWKRQFGGDLWEGILAMEFEPTTNNILIGGCQNWEKCEGYCRSYDNEGNLLWKKEFVKQGENGGTCGKDIAVDKDGNIYHTGGTGAALFGENSGSKDIYIVKLSRSK